MNALCKSLAFGLVASLALASSTFASFVAQPVTLALDWKPEPEFGGFYEALLDEEFSKLGIKATIVPGGSGQPTIQMVSGGKVEFATVSADELIVARANGAQPVALFAVYQNSPAGIMVHRAQGFTSLKDVFEKGGEKGLTLALQKGLPYVSHLEKKYGFSKVKVVPYAGGISSFLADAKFGQQCFVTSEPLSATKAKSDPQTFLVADSGYNPYTTVVVTNAEFAKKNSDLVKRFVRVIKLGWERYLKDPTRANAEMQKLNPGMDLETFAESAKTQAPLIETKDTKKGGLGMMTVTRWKELADQLYDLKVIKTKVDCSDCVWKP